jgi:hypothetical protein
MTDDREVLTLSLQRVEVDVVLTGSDGVEHKWLLRELSGSERNKYLNRMTSRVKVGAGGSTTIKSFDGFQSDLLHLCLLDGDGERVSKEIIEDLPSSTQLAIFNKAQKISGLDADKEGDEGNV